MANRSSTSDLKIKYDQKRFFPSDSEEIHFKNQTTTDDHFINKKKKTCGPELSSIIGILPNSSTFLIHFLDNRWSWTQTVKISSLLGAVRVFGYQLRPMTFYSIFNYRTNSILPVELLKSSEELENLNLSKIKLFVNDENLAEKAFSKLKTEGGDLLLVKPFDDNENSFLKTIREKSNYSFWFDEEKISIDEKNNWSKLEQNCSIQFVETNEKTSILTDPQLEELADLVIDRWKNEKNFPFVVLICGEKDLGKSTLNRYLVNRTLNKKSNDEKIFYFDFDLGQSEFSMGGCVSFVEIKTPIFGPPSSHIQLEFNDDRLLFYGNLSPQISPLRYLEFVDRLKTLWKIQNEKSTNERSIIFVNTMGWCQGLGLELLKEIICLFSPKILIHLTSRNDSNRFDVPWLMKQPVFLPFRKKKKMSAQRQPNYDGLVNYEYFRIESRASSIITKPKNNQRILRPRDHRLLATWSYFFSSKLNQIEIDRSKIVHICQKTQFQQLTDKIERSIVALCSTPNIQELRRSARYIKNTFITIEDEQNECFECFGFGWIQQWDFNRNIYKIFTPMNNQVEINLLISGSFDIPEQFSSIFQSLSEH